MQLIERSGFVCALDRCYRERASAITVDFKRRVWFLGVGSV